MNNLPFQFTRRGRNLRNAEGAELSALMEDRDRELEDFLGDLWQLASNQIVLGSSPWTYATATTAPPTSGQVRTNSGATVMYIHEVDGQGINQAWAMEFLNEGDRFQVSANNGTAARLRVAGTPIDQGTYYEFPIEVLSGDLEIKKNDTVVITLVQRVEVG